MSLNHRRSHELAAEAGKYLVGGVDSPVRAFKAVGSEPIIARSGNGGYITDEDGNSYLDFCLSWGVFILGHRFPSVVGAASDALSDGSSFGLTSRFEAELASRITRAVPGAEKVRFVNSGTEAVMSALRLARGYTGKDYVIKFDGCYHGHSDSLLVNAGSGVSTLNLTSSAGIPKAFTGYTLSIPFNDRKILKETVEKYSGKLAAVVLEPVPANMGVIRPDPEFLKDVIELTHKAGGLVIFDEVITGFRFSEYSAQGHYGLRPDLTTLGKIVGGGFPAAAFCGPSEIMNLLAPVGPVYQAGTLSGNPVAMRAGIATLDELLSGRVYKALEEKAEKFFASLEKSIEGFPVSLSRNGFMFTLFFRKGAPRCYSEVKECDFEAFGAWFRFMLDHGFYVSPSQFETDFLSIAHDDGKLAEMAETTGEFLRSYYAA
jgi:glutamate-1-semialdehyde 2,1-aminomutase